MPLDEFIAIKDSNIFSTIMKLVLLGTTWKCDIKAFLNAMVLVPANKVGGWIEATLLPLAGTTFIAPF